MNRPTILIADDEEAICFALSREARRHAVEPLVVADGCRVVAIAETAGAEFIAAILDIRMPGLDGVSAALTIRQLYPSVPLALMTAFGSVELPTALGGVRVFWKPFELVTFSDWLASAVTPPPHPRVGIGLPPRPAGAA